MVVVRLVDQTFDVADGGCQIWPVSFFDQQPPDLFQPCFVHHSFTHRSTQ